MSVLVSDDESKTENRFQSYNNPTTTKKKTHFEEKKKKKKTKITHEQTKP